MSTHYVTGVAGIPTETVTFALPRKWTSSGTKPAIILLPGTGEGTQFPFNPTVAQPLIKALTDAGFPVGCATPINQWGNDYCRLWISSIRTHMQTVLGARTGKIGLIGLSQGGFNVLSWAGANSTLTGAVTGYLAPPDLEIAAGTQGYGNAVNDAYGGTYSEITMGAQYNPQTMAENGAYAGIPIELVYASNDDVVPLSMQTAFKNAVGSNVVQVNGGATGHSWNVTTANAQILPRLVSQMSSF
ncbi:hypothetical protein HY312_04245 [Candidatus Saccharibacteria bacterium]|nr:hypothetical protein [Candidatus Saccharibacteria bacterium]